MVKKIKLSKDNKLVITVTAYTLLILISGICLALEKTGYSIFLFFSALLFLRESITLLEGGK